MKWIKGKIGFLFGWIALGIAVAGLLYIIIVPRAVPVDVAKVTLGSFKETIRSDGILRSKDRYTVTATANGDIKRVSLKMGDPISKDERITDLIWDRYETIRAPISGVISKVYRESAGPISRGEPIVEIVDPSRLEVMAELLTTDAVRLREGSEAWFDNWDDGPPIKAKVVRVSKAGYTKLSALGVEEERTEVIADLVNPPAKLLQNAGSTYHVDVTFKVREIQNAVKVPAGALFREGSGWSVYLAENGRAVKRAVTMDALNSQEASVTQGLTPGQIVLVYPGDLVKDGSRIKLR